MGTVAPEEDDLEEGELKDDDDDDDDEEFYEVDAKKDESKVAKLKQTHPDDVAPAKHSSSSSSSSRTPSSSSSSSSSSPSIADEESKPQPSSKSSSRNGSHYEPYSKVHSFNNESRLRSRHSIIDKFRSGREREDPSEKAAKLISMRTKLLEARSREIELKFQKNKIRLMSPPTPRLGLDQQQNVKMTVTKPSISYNENPNPSRVIPAITAVETPKKSKSKRGERERKSKKSKKKKKGSSKKHKKRKSSSSSKKVPSDSKVLSTVNAQPALPFNNSDHLGPKTPPDNQVLTLNNEQIEWPSHLIKMTLASPSISFSVNPDSVNSMNDDDGEAAAILKRRRSTVSSLTDQKRFKGDEKYSSFSSSSSQKATSPYPHKIENSSSYRKYQSMKNIVYDLDLNHDYSWYHSYFMNSFDMDSNQAHHQALSAVISGSYNPEVLEKWLNAKGLSKRSFKDPDIKKQLYPLTIRESIDSPIPDAEQVSAPSGTDGTVGSSIKTVVTRIARNLVNKHDEQHGGEKKEIKAEIDVKEENLTNQAMDPDQLGNEANSENFNEIENEAKKCETLELKMEPTDQNQSSTKELTSNNTCISLRPIQPRITIIKSQREIVLPNGLTLPAGTIQRIVHPYPRVDTETLGPCFDLY